MNLARFHSTFPYRAPPIVETALRFTIGSSHPGTGEALRRTSGGVQGRWYLGLPYWHVKSPLILFPGSMNCDQLCYVLSDPHEVIPSGMTDSPLLAVEGV